MALDLTQLAGALRLGDGLTAPGEPYAGILNRLMGVAAALIDQQAPNAPEGVKDEATVRFVAYSFDSPTAAGGERYANAWRNSGAAALLAPWTPRRAGIEAEGVS